MKLIMPDGSFKEVPKQEEQVEQPVVETRVDTPEEKIARSYTSVLDNLMSRFIQRVQLSGQSLSRNDIPQIQQMIMSALEMEILSQIMLKVGITDVEELVTEERQNAILSLFKIEVAPTVPTQKLN